MKKILGIVPFFYLISFVACAQKSENPAPLVQKKAATVVHLTSEEFKKVVFDYSTEKDWKYLGKLPCIIDFYADWCRPCRTIAPYMDELAKEYDGKLIVYKVNVDKEKEAASAFGVGSIPLVIFCPMEGAPASQPGALSLEDYRKIVETYIFK